MFVWEKFDECTSSLIPYERTPSYLDKQGRRLSHPMVLSRIYIEFCICTEGTRGRVTTFKGVFFYDKKKPTTTTTRFLSYELNLLL